MKRSGSPFEAHAISAWIVIIACLQCTTLAPLLAQATRNADEVQAKTTLGDETRAAQTKQDRAIASEPAAAIGKFPVELEADFRWLFDGKSLAGWEGKAAWFRVEEESIVAGSLKEKIPNNEFLCTEEKFADFELRLQVRLKGEGNNAGVQFRSERIVNHHEVSGYQCDVGNAFGRSVWGALYDESRRKKMLAEGPPADVNRWTKPDQWNDLWIRCQAERVQLWLNGNPTVDYRESDATISKTGIIGLQIHSGPPTEAWYRAIRLRKLPKES